MSGWQIAEGHPVLHARSQADEGIGTSDPVVVVSVVSSPPVSITPSVRRHQGHRHARNTGFASVCRPFLFTSVQTKSRSELFAETADNRHGRVVVGHRLAVGCARGDGDVLVLFFARRRFAAIEPHIVEVDLRRDELRASCPLLSTVSVVPLSKLRCRRLPEYN